MIVTKDLEYLTSGKRREMSETKPEPKNEEKNHFAGRLHYIKTQNTDSINFVLTWTSNSFAFNPFGGNNGRNNHYRPFVIRTWDF